MPFLDATVLQDDSDGLGFLRDVLGTPAERPTLSERFEPRAHATDDLGRPFADRRVPVGMAEAALT